MIFNFFFAAKTGQWLQVYLSEPTTVTGVITQGRYHDQWITTYMMQYGNDTTALLNVEDEQGQTMVS